MYKWALIETEKKRKELSDTHIGLMKEHSALSDEYMDLLNKNSSMNTAFKDIRESMTCAICLEIFDDEKAAMIGSCGHVLHQECLQKQQPTMRDVCPSCRKKKSWQKFSGYTGIATALKNLETAGGAP
jgi:hypothetical protein